MLKRLNALKIKEKKNYDRNCVLSLRYGLFAWRTTTRRSNNKVIATVNQQQWLYERIRRL